MAREKIEFTGALGEKLCGRLDIPDDREPRAYILFAHCFTGSKDVLAAKRIARSLWLRGFAIFRFDFTGLGDSEGDFANTTFSSNVEDLVAAAKYLREQKRAPAVLIGHSLGGAAVIAAAQHIPEVRGVCTIGAPSDPAHVTHHFGDALSAIEYTGEAQVNIGGRNFRMKRSFLNDLKWQEQEHCIENLGRALLIFHSQVDDIVGIENAGQIYQAAKHPKSFISLDGADHMLTNKEDSCYVAEVISAWVHRYGFCLSKKNEESRIG
jgi:alpha/beta superfamily hydrolase